MTAPEKKEEKEFAWKLDRLEEKIRKQNLRMFRTRDITDNSTSTSMSTSFKLFTTNWKTPSKFEQCDLCKCKVAAGFMNDHLDQVCREQLIECKLCQQRIKRKELISHWKDGSLCAGYSICCPRCNASFSSKAEYIQHQHDESYPDYKDENKYKWYFSADANSEEYKQLYIHKTAVCSIFVCAQCGQRCENNSKEADEHRCIDYMNDETFDRSPLYIMRYTAKGLVAFDCVENMVRTQIKMFIPPEIKQLIVKYRWAPRGRRN